MLVMFRTGASWFDTPCASGATVNSLLTTKKRNLLVCTCLVSGWHKLSAFMHFLDDDDDDDDDDDTNLNFRGFIFLMKNKLCKICLNMLKK
jgi:hypothetical protein